MIPARSLLFVPATSTDKIDKAFAGGADGVIVDLEDAVAHAQKGVAREGLAAMFTRSRAVPGYVRVNAASTEHCLRDLLALPLAGLAGIFLPKVESATDLATVDWVLGQREREAGIEPGTLGVQGMIETARGLRAIDAIAHGSPRLRRLVFGAVDFAADLGTGVEDDAVTVPVRVAIAGASRAAGLEPPLDAPQMAVRDDARLRASAIRARSLGFGGKLCIHPAQVATVNDVFAPTADELAWARRVVTAFDEAEAQGRAALTVDGNMVDYPVVERARRLLAAAPQ